MIPTIIRRRLFPSSWPEAARGEEGASTGYGWLTEGDSDTGTHCGNSLAHVVGSGKSTFGATLPNRRVEETRRIGKRCVCGCGGNNYSPGYLTSVLVPLRLEILIRFPALRHYNGLIDHVDEPTFHFLMT